MTTSADIIVDEGTLRLAAQHNVFISRWTAAPQVEQMRRLREELRAFRDKHPSANSYVNVIVGGVPRFEKDVRDVAAQMAAEPAPGACCAVHLVLIDGMAGSAVRAFLSTMLLVSRTHVPTKVFGSPDDAAAWMLPLLEREGSTPWTLAGLTQLLREVGAA